MCEAFTAYSFDVFTPGVAVVIMSSALHWQMQRWGHTAEAFPLLDNETQ
jgi:hypothetical protein